LGFLSKWQIQIVQSREIFEPTFESYLQNSIKEDCKKKFRIRTTDVLKGDCIKKTDLILWIPGQLRAAVSARPFRRTDV
jgi:hypothetical protein